MRPYFYILQSKETGQYYGGASWGKDSKEILTEYHTSSDVVKSMGIDNFILRKIKYFDTDADAQRYEHRFLFKVKAAANDNWLNRNYGNTPIQTGKTWWNNGTKSTLAYVCPEGYMKGRILNKANLGKYEKTEEQKKRISESLKGNMPWNKGMTGVQTGHKKFKDKSWSIVDGKRVWKEKD